MTMYERILVAVDGSSSSLHALRQAFRITRGPITALAVAPPYEGDLRLVGVKNLESLLTAPCDKALAEANRLAQQEQVPIKTLCEFGDPYVTISEVAESERCQLIVLGKSGPDLLQWALMGSVTGRVIGHTGLDVLVVPEGTIVGWKRILLATDGSEYSKRATARAMELCEVYGADLTVVSVLDFPPEFYVEAPELGERLSEEARHCVSEVRAQAEGRRLSPECLVRTGEPYKVIVTMAREKQADVIILGSHGRSGLKRLLMGSVTERVIGHAPCPVLVVKQDPRAA
jgi:nucleotide-binding universal stress UspA family protein